MALELVCAWVMLVSLGLYVLLGGADFGAGVWSLLASGARKHEQRERLAAAIVPIWEANHVWLILVVVLLFTCFPPAFAAISTALHVPLTLILLGIVCRGSAFMFWLYGGGEKSEQRGWRRVFAAASLVTPVFLGITLGTAASGRLHWDEAGVYTSGFFGPWLHWFPWSVGAFTLAIFAFLAAVYLCAELKDGPLREDFRRRAMFAAGAVGVTAAMTWALAGHGAGELGHRLVKDWWALPLQVVTGVLAVGAIAALWRRRFLMARALAVGQVVCIVLGYGAGLFPYLVVAQFTIENSAAPARTHVLVLGALGAGAVILFPSLYYLYRVFKGSRVFAVVDDASDSSHRDG